jgi:hypothetical protein
MAKICTNCHIEKELILFRVRKNRNNTFTIWTWNIDHITTHSNFPYISMADQEFKACWALTNLRPYSAKQNIIDGCRRK